MNTDTNTPDKNEGQELIPCPFCGEDEDLYVSVNHVGCGYCGAMSGFIEPKQFGSNKQIKKWNTRKALSNSEGT